MRLRFAILSVVVLCGGRATTYAQAVQLPTFRQFSVSTSVSVPDSGGGVIGGVGRASSGSSQRGLPVIGIPGVRRPAASRSIARSDIGGGVSVGVQIHDLDGMDRQLLAGTSRKAALPHRAQTSVLNGPTGSLADIRRARAERQQASSSAVDDLLARGRRASLAGKSALAQTYFRMAAEQSSGAQRDEVLAALRANRHR